MPRWSSQRDQLNSYLAQVDYYTRHIGENPDWELDYLDGAQWQTEVTPDLFENLVERITVVSADEVRFRLLNGLELAERLA